MLEEVHPPALAGDPAHQGTARLLPADLVFFRFMTLTTVGYGDIILISAEARLVAVFEAVAGVFLLAFLVALSRAEEHYRHPARPPGRHTSGPEHPPGATSVCVWADMLSLTPLLRYDGRTAHALSPTPDARYTHALTRHAGDRAGLAR